MGCEELLRKVKSKLQEQKTRPWEGTEGPQEAPGSSVLRSDLDTGSGEWALWAWRTVLPDQSAGLQSG